MARVVAVGHGSFDTKSEMILVPKDTTITFLADAGSPLRLPCVSTLPAGEKPADGVWTDGVNCRIEYEKVANLLDNYLEADKPRKFGDVLPNMFVEPLGPESARVARELEAHGKWGGGLMMTAESSSLCHGDSRRCPTPMLNVAKRNHTRFDELDPEKQNRFKEWVAAGATVGTIPEGMADFAAPELTDVPELYYEYLVEGVPEDRWEHDCDGLLGKDVAGGNDIVWLSCSDFLVDQEALNAIGLPEGLPQEMRQGTHGPGADWVPSNDDFDRIAKLNAQKLNDTPNGGKIRLRVGDPLVVIGDGHEGTVENYLKRKEDVSEGTITVKKGSAFKGTLTVEGIPESQRKIVEDALASSKNNIFFGGGTGRTRAASV
jgi:hypothetical protein